VNRRPERHRVLGLVGGVVGVRALPVYLDLRVELAFEEPPGVLVNRSLRT
jgi:hypothetical protein